MSNEGSSNRDSQENKIIICDNCGEENKSDHNYCLGCGIKLKNKYSMNSQKRTVKKKNEEGQKSLGRNQSKSKIKKNKNKQPKVEEAPRKFSSVKLFYLVMLLGIIGVINLLVAGIFEEPKANITQNSELDNVHSGVDMDQERKISELKNQVKNNPNDSELLLSLAHLLNDNGHELEAIQRYNEYLKINPQNANVIVDLGVCYFDLREYDKAKEKMMQAMKIEPNHQIAHFNMGIINSASGNMVEAKKWWQKVIEIDPNTKIAEKAKEFINSN